MCLTASALLCYVLNKAVVLLRFFPDSGTALSIVLIISHDPLANTEEFKRYNKYVPFESHPYSQWEEKIWT